MRGPLRYLRDRRGAAAVEMALILPGVLFLLVGGVNLIMLTYATISLHNATEAAARYASTYTAANSGTNPTSTTVANYAAGWYRGPGINQSFTYAATGTCGSTGANGNAVTATGTYHLLYGIKRLAVTINSQACFP